ncbi:hypothetical protein LUZ60_014926 [Juncus effusus]|nr:hypothetical protein LUZ60_014926 [Juncus effusus]
MAAIQWETLPLGTLFRPSEELLLNHYLFGKLTTTLDDSTCPITEVIIATYDPWELPWKSTVTTEREEWYFFVPVEKKNPNQKGFINRTTPNGSWRQSGPDRKIFSNISGLKMLIGMRKHLLFYDHEGHRRGKVSEWIIHEYRLASESQSDAYHEGYVICKLVRRSKRWMASRKI